MYICVILFLSLWLFFTIKFWNSNEKTKKFIWQKLFNFTKKYSVNLSNLKLTRWFHLDFFIFWLVCVINEFLGMDKCAIPFVTFDSLSFGLLFLQRWKTKYSKNKWTWIRVDENMCCIQFKSYPYLPECHVFIVHKN